MDIAGAVEMFLLYPEGAANLAVVLHAVVEWPVIGLEIVPAPGTPAPKFALGFHMQIGAVQECGFGQLVHAIWPLIEQFSP